MTKLFLLLTVCFFSLEVFSKNIEVFTNQCESRKSIMQPVFNEIEKIKFDLSFDDCLQVVNKLKQELLSK